MLRGGGLALLLHRLGVLLRVGGLTLLALLGWGRLPPLLLLFLGWFWALFAFGWFCAGAGAALGSGFFWGADSA